MSTSLDNVECLVCGTRFKGRDMPLNICRDCCRVCVSQGTEVIRDRLLEKADEHATLTARLLNCSATRGSVVKMFGNALRLYIKESGTEAEAFAKESGLYD